MKKTLTISLLGVAVLGIAAVPAYSSFADEPVLPEATLSHVDAINLNVEAACTLGTIDTGVDATTHTNGSYVNGQTGETGLGVWGANDTLYATMQAGTTAPDLGSTTFTIRCNNADGYVLQAYGENPDESDIARLVSGDNYILSGTTGTDSFWNFKFSQPAGGEMTITSGYTNPTTIYGEDVTQIVAKKTASGTMEGEQVTATYGVSLSSSQPSGTYTGSVVYTLYQLNGETPEPIPETEPTEPTEPEEEPEPTDNPVTYSITFKNSDGTDLNIPKYENAISYDLLRVNLPGSVSSAYAPTGGDYKFIGWTETQGKATADYAPYGKITLSSKDSFTQITLYAVWEKQEEPAPMMMAPRRNVTYNNTYNNYYNEIVEETVVEGDSSESNEQNEEKTLIRDEDLDIEEDDLKSGKTDALGVVATSERDDNWILPAILIALAIAALAGIGYYLYTRHEENKE